MRKWRVLIIISILVIGQLLNNKVLYAEVENEENTEIVIEGNTEENSEITEEVDESSIEEETEENSENVIAQDGEESPENAEEEAEDTTDTIEEDTEGNIDESEEESEEPEETYIPVTDLDISTFMQEMEVGDKQLLSIIVLPLNATDSNISYTSSDESVAEINALGRITAIKNGTTEISIIAADGIIEKFTLKVSRTQSTYVGVTDLDLGEYKTELCVEESQTISTMTLPYNATDSTVRFVSSNPKVASINGFGKITGITVGTTVIKAYVAGINRSFELNVKPKKDTHVKDIDLGDYMSEMETGDSQLIYPAILPVDAINPGFIYSSKNEKVATINGLGRITAVAEGTTKITITSDSIVKTIELTVKKKQEIKINELDLGDFPDSLKVGESRLINLSVLPYEAGSRVIVYESLNPEVATVNSFGRIHGVSIGDVQILVTADEIIRTMDLKIEESDEYQVEAINIAEYENEMEEDKSQQLAVTVLPEKASSATLAYSSSNPRVATISSSGEIKTASVGHTTITIEAGDIIKQFNLTVVTATSKIQINQTYLLLKEEEEFQLECQVFPKEATQTIEYESMNEDVVTVSEEGLLTALNIGQVTIIVTNNYMQKAVTVIVNKKHIQNSTIVEGELKSATIDSMVLSLLKSTDNIIKLNNKDVGRISKTELKYIYDTKKVLAIDSEEYNISLSGNDIVNYENELTTDIVLQRDGSDIRFTINNGNNLPGKIAITLSELNNSQERYLYLYNESKNKFEILNNSYKQGTIEIDTAGEYMLTDSKLNKIGINVIFIFGFIVCIVALTLIYIGTKKKYWFW